MLVQFTGQVFNKVSQCLLHLPVGLVDVIGSYGGYGVAEP